MLVLIVGCKCEQYVDDDNKTRDMSEIHFVRGRQVEAEKLVGVGVKSVRCPIEMAQEAAKSVPGVFDIQMDTAKLYGKEQAILIDIEFRGPLSEFALSAEGLRKRDSAPAVGAAGPTFRTGVKVPAPSPG